MKPVGQRRSKHVSQGAGKTHPYHNHGRPSTVLAEPQAPSSLIRVSEGRAQESELRHTLHSGAIIGRVCGVKMAWYTSSINYPLPRRYVFLEGRTACVRLAEHSLLMTDKYFILQDWFQCSCHHDPLTLQHCLRAGKTPIIRILLILCQSHVQMRVRGETSISSHWLIISW